MEIEKMNKEELINRIRELQGGEEWVRFEDLGIEVNFKQEQNGKEFKDIKIPNGCRVLRFEELEPVINYIVENNLVIWSYFEQPIRKYNKKYIARFDASSVRVDFSCYGDPRDSSSSLGVIFCREIKKEDSG